MGRRNRVPLDDRVARAAERALAVDHSVSAIDVLTGIGWLDSGAVEQWRRGQIGCLEEAAKVDASRISEAMHLFRAWAAARGLLASETAYLDRTPQRQTLRFTRTGDPAVEAAYRIQWVSPKLSEAKRDRLANKASRAPDLVVVQPLNKDWKCHRCGGSGDLLMMEPPGPACLTCVGLADLEFLPAGDALLSRRAKAASSRCAVVVRFSRTRRRYERQGLLVEPNVLAGAP